MDPSPALISLEAEEDVAVLLAVESGSRAWGFASPDSDWDVRFLYARPTLWHVQLQPGRDVIERTLPGDLDLAGWDMRKALNLLLRGNCALREWLCSPIVYTAQPDMVQRLRMLAECLPTRRAALHHYASLAYKVRERWLRRDPVRLKKYLYAVRPALALRWMRTHPALMPPMDMRSLVADVALSAEEATALDELLRRKAEASELGSGAAIPTVDAMIETELQAARVAMVLEPAAKPSLEWIAAANTLLMDAARLADDRARAR